MKEKLLTRVLACCVVLILSIAIPADASDIADAAKNRDLSAIRSLIARRVNVNEPQIDGATALHWAAAWNDTEAASLLIRAGGDVRAVNRAGATPLLLAALNGSAGMIETLIAAGADPNTRLTTTGDTALMLATRTGILDAVQVLLDKGAELDAREAWGGTTALMWAVSAGHTDIVRMLIGRGANVNMVTTFVPAVTGRGMEGVTPRNRIPGQEDGKVQDAAGELTPLMFAARQGHLDAARLLVDAGANVNATVGDGKDALGLAVFNGNYELASFLIDRGANVNQADAQGFTPLFWAVDRRNMETAPNFAWTILEDPLPLIEKLLNAGANPNHLVDNTPRARMREGSPRIVYATALMRAAFSGDLELVRLLLKYRADPQIKSKDDETTLMAAAGLGFVEGFHSERPRAQRLEVVKLLVELGSDVNAADDYGITALMVAANLGDVAIIGYLIDAGADLGAHDFGKKNDGSFGSSIEPLMPIDYAIGIGTFRPNNAIVFHDPAFELMSRRMKEKGIAHITSECTLRGFTCSKVNMDPKTATPAEIERARAYQTGHQVAELKATGLEVKEVKEETPKQ